MQTKFGIAAVLLSGLGYGSTAVLVIKAYQCGATPWQLLLSQSTVALIILVGILSLRRKSIHFSIKDLVLLALIGVFGSASIAVCYTLSLQYISGSIATLIFFTYPVFVTIGSGFIFHESYTFHKILALLLACAGVFLTVRIFDAELADASMRGIFLCLVAAVGAASSILLVQDMLKRYVALDIALIQQFFAAGVLILLIWGNRMAAYEGMDTGIWLFGFFLATITSLIPTFLTFKGVSYLGAYRASVVSTAEIPLTLLLVFIFLKESLTGVQWLGSGLIFCSLLLANRR